MPELLSAKRLREQRHEIAKSIRTMADKINAESRDFTAEERTSWEKANGDYNALTARIEIAERAQSVEEEQDRRIEKRIGREDFDGRRKPGHDKPGRDEPITEEDRSLALQAWMRVQSRREITQKHLRACKRVGLNPRRREIGLSLRSDYAQVKTEWRALSVGTTTAGGFTVPQGFVDNLERAMLQFGGVRAVANILRTDTGNDMPWPTVNDTSNSGELLAEGGSIGSSTDPSFGQVIMKAYKYSSKVVLVSTELLDDSAFDMARELGSMLGERIGRIQNTHFTTGDNSSKPQGIVTASTLGKTAASATAIAADELFDLFHSIDPAYRADASMGWMMHDNILLAIRKLKSTTNEYLWQDSMRAGTPQTLLGYPITINQQMQSSIATGTKTVLVGAFGKYKIRDVNQVRVRRLVERYADTDQEAFISFLRSDGRLLNAGTNPVKHLIQA